MDRARAMLIAHEIAGEHFGTPPSPWDLIPRHPERWVAMLSALTNCPAGNDRGRMFREILEVLPDEVKGTLMRLEESWGAELAVQTEATFLLGVAFGRHLTKCSL